MALKPPKPKRTLIEAGSHLAVCTMIADIGSHESEFQGRTKVNYEVVMMFEFPDLRNEIEKDGKKISYPKRKTEKYTFSYHEKSNLGKIMKSWLGRLPDADFDLFEMLGKNAMVTIIHEESKSGTSYDKIATITQLPARISPAEPEGKLIRYSMQEDKQDFPEHLPDWIKNEVMSSKEWESIQRFGERQDETGEPMPDDTTDYGVDDDSEIPF